MRISTPAVSVALIMLMSAAILFPVTVAQTNKPTVRVPPPPPGYEEYAGRWSVSAEKPERYLGPASFGVCAESALDSYKYGYRFVGTCTDYEADGIQSKIWVTDADVPHAANNYNYFFYSWVMVHDGGTPPTKWIQIGWGEFSQKSDDQYVAVYDTVNGWYIYTDAYDLTVGNGYHFCINYQGLGAWSAWIWWNNEWVELLDTINLSISSGQCLEQAGEQYVYNDQSWFSISNTSHYCTSLLINDEWDTLDSTYASYTTVTEQSPYDAYWTTYYNDWYEYYSS